MQSNFNPNTYSVRTEYTTAIEIIRTEDTITQYGRISKVPKRFISSQYTKGSGSCHRKLFDVTDMQFDGHQSDD